MILHRLHHIRFFSALPRSLRVSPSTELIQCNRKLQEHYRLGRLMEARHLFDSMSQRDDFSWNVMITAYTKSGLLQEAQMLFDAFHGKNVRTWTILLSGYAKHGLVDEARVIFESMPERNIVSWNAMISGYANHGLLDEARVIFESMPERNIVSWNSMISVYASHGLVDEARVIFESMPESDVASWNAMITGYVQNGRLKCARELFNQMPERNIISWNSMIKGYCHGGMMCEARELFCQMQETNDVSWLVMISGYVNINDYRVAWDLFFMMFWSGVKPDQSVLVAALSAAMGLNEMRLIENLRTVAIKTGYDGNVIVGTAILNAYTRNGSLDHAFKYFETMQERNEYSWTTMIAAFSQCGRLNDAIALYGRDTEKSVATRSSMVTAYAQNGRISEARCIFDEIESPDVVTWNAMLAGYAQNGMLEEAKDMFLRMPEKNAASCAAMISGFVQNGHSREAVEFFTELHRSGIFPSNLGFTSALVACANIGDVGVGRQIHALTITTGNQFDLFVRNGLISMYATCKNIEDVSQVFSIKRATDCVSWNLFNAGLSENHMLDEARKTFEKTPKRDVVSWTAIISAYAQAGQADTAFKLFLEMLATGMKPNQYTVTSLLSTCGYLGARKLGEQIHCLIQKLGLISCLFVCNALITMYFKCGSLDGLCIFEDMPDRDIVTWNAVLAGYAQNGLGKETINIFHRMEASGVSPNEISYVGLLCACSHAGLVDEGWAYFNSMSEIYGITPLVYHYTCMVDLLGRAGQLYEAEALIENMHVKPDSVIWEALLGACRIHREMKLGQRVAEKLFKMGTKRSGTYVLLSNIYASQGMWEKVREIRELMKERRVTKEPGISWVQIKNKVHHFQDGVYSFDTIL